MSEDQTDTFTKYVDVSYFCHNENYYKNWIYLFKISTLKTVNNVQL